MEAIGSRGGYAQSLLLEPDEAVLKTGIERDADQSGQTSFVAGKGLIHGGSSCAVARRWLRTNGSAATRRRYAAPTKRIPRLIGDFRRVSGEGKSVSSVAHDRARPTDGRETNGIGEDSRRLVYLDTRNDLLLFLQRLVVDIVGLVVDGLESL